MFGKALIWFYVLDIHQSALLVLAMTALFIFVVHKRIGRREIAWISCICLLLWLAAAAAITIGTRTSSENCQVNLRLFHSYVTAVRERNKELYRSNYMNVLLFYPGGLFAGFLFCCRKRRGLWVLGCTVLFCLLSVGIEWSQYSLQIGFADVDDVFHNTLGAVIGLLAGAFGPTMQFKRLKLHHKNF